jgi:aspartate racemase
MQQNVRPIGVLGGTSWPSTLEYLREFNQLAQSTLGGHHSANLILRHIDYHEIKRRYGQRWNEEIPALLAQPLKELASYNPCCIVVANNTLHKAIPEVISQLPPSIPIINIIDAVAEECRQADVRSVLLLAVRFTMEDGFFAERLEQCGVQVSVPTLEDRLRIQDIQSRVSRGESPEPFKPYFTELLQRWRHLDGAVLACTELPLVVDPAQAPLPIFDSGRAQVRKAFQYYCAVANSG